jgi:hypothetical protein
MDTTFTTGRVGMETQSAVNTHFDDFTIDVFNPDAGAL